ncbi:MAG TPA: beta-ketoacyl-[acyl-carrier-protein] synthase family protein [Tepidisphaeraceae bacterium]|jgi:3-oxoacyl-[acyl-carrier-protein] synthase II|nr:beta-ketoacyl-[acyl-carrier-protein] synthase family protein [Tepidisphaeraceae bacterium]
MSQNRQRIVISGAGLVTGLGLSREQTWESILRGQCAMGPMSAIETPLPPGKDGGQAPDLPHDFAPELPREARYLKWAITQALDDARVEPSVSQGRRCVCLLGTTLHGMRAAGRYLRSGDLAALGQFLAGTTLQLAIEKSLLRGWSATTCSACSSSLGSIALGVTLLQNGQADLVIAGGYDPISEYVWAGFNSLRLVADGPLRPFAKNRQGMKLAEGYGVVVLERAGDAARRKINPLATILGWGESADAHHLTQPHPEGAGAVRAIKQALALAGLGPEDIDLIAAHATGTPDNDASEFAALSRVFENRLPKIPVVAFKSHLGHTLGGAGTVELILSAMALRNQIVPACVNVTAEEVEFDGLRLATGQPRSEKLRHSLNISLGFGGANTCMILGPAQPPPTAVTPPQPREVLITGIGVVLPGIIGNDALVARLTANAPPAWNANAGGVPEAELLGLLSARRVRRMSDYVKLTLAAATLACRDAGIDDVPAFAADCAAILGTLHGSVNYSTDYYRQIVKDGLIAANPMLFAESVPNAGAAQLSLMLSLKSACQSIIGTRTAGLDAIALAAARIRSGSWERAIVGAGEEFCELVNEAYGHCGVGAPAGCAPFSGETGFVTGAGAVIFVLESRPSMEQRRGRARGRIDATAACSGDRAGTIESLGWVLDELKNPANILSSACGTWIDRAEAAAIRRSNGARSVSAIYGHIAESFSVSPLVGLAAAMLSHKMPRLLGGAWENSRGILGATGDQSVDTLAAICTDFTGIVSGVSLSII